MVSFLATCDGVAACEAQTSSRQSVSILLLQHLHVVTIITGLHTADSVVLVESAGRYEMNVRIAPTHALTIDSEDHR
jgi:hypothetical protein